MGLRGLEVSLKACPFKATSTQGEKFNYFYSTRFRSLIAYHFRLRVIKGFYLRHAQLVRLYSREGVFGVFNTL